VTFRTRYLIVFYRWSSRLVHRMFPDENTLLLVMALVVGVGSGLGAVGFEILIHGFQHGFTAMARAFPHTDHWPWLGRIVALLVGGLLGGVLIHTIFPASAGHGVPDVMAGVAVRGGRIRSRVALETSITAGICIGSGGSAGPEGPIVQIGSSIGSTVGKAIRMSTERLRILTACGAAGGISAIFGAPLAGVMFAVEVILGDFGVRSLTAIVVASVLAAVTHQAFYSWEPRFEVPHIGQIGFGEVPLVLALGLLAGLGSWALIKALYRTEDFFTRLPLPKWVKPALGMLAVGVIAVGYPQVLGGGYDTVSDVLNLRIAWATMAVLVVAKLAATCFTVGSGNIGGLFAPSMVIGALMGGAFGIAAEFVFPNQQASVALFALMGMAALIAGTTHATIASILLIFEVTHDWALVLPVMLASAVSVGLSSVLQRESIYTLKLKRDGIRLRRGVEVNVMSSIPVSEVMKPPQPVIPRHMPFTELLEVIRSSTENAFPVVDEDGRLTGVIGYRDLRAVLDNSQPSEFDALVLAGDMAVPNPEYVTPGMSLNDAMRLFGVRDLSVLPVVDSRESRRLIGRLYRSDVLTAYRRALISG